MATSIDAAVRVAIIGAGSVGGLMACLLSQLPTTRVQLTVLARGENLTAIRTNGLRVKGWEQTGDGILVSKNLTCLESTAEAASSLGAQDYVVVALKAHGITAALDVIQPLLGDHTAVVTVQNGIPWWYKHCSGMPEDISAKIDLSPVDPGSKALEMITAARAIGAVARVATEIIEPGVVMAYSPWLKLVMGEAGNQETPRLQQLADLLQEAGIGVTPTTNIRQAIWSKLMGNAFFNPLTTLSLTTWSELAGLPQTDELAKGVMHEVWNIAKAAGVDMADIHPDKHIENFRTNLIPGFTSSMAEDLRKGRPLETEALLTVPISMARVLGCQTPRMETLLALLCMRAWSRQQGR